MTDAKPFFENEQYKRSFADVPIDAANDNAISTKEFIEACNTLVVIFDYLKSAAFSPVKSDITNNVTKINVRYEAAPAESATLQDLVINELKTKTHTATEGLLWLTRGLEFISLALNANIKNEKEELADSFKAAYTVTLQPHHGWLVKPVFKAAMSACPYRKKFYADVSLNKEDAEFQANMEAYLASLQKVVDILKPFINGPAAKW